MSKDTLIVNFGINVKRCPLTRPHFTIFGVDEWKSGANLWPPEDGVSLRTLSIAKMKIHSGTVVNNLDIRDPSQKLQLDIDFSATSGFASRWNLVQHIMKRPITYPDRAEQLQNTLGFSTDPLGQDIRIVGSPRVSLSLQLNEGAYDTAVFAYLDDIDPVSGVIRYITEGSIRASHRALEDDARGEGIASLPPIRAGSIDTIRRSFLQRDMTPLAGPESTIIDFMMEPVAYALPAGHILRLSFAGSDVDNYYLDNIHGLASTWYIDTANSKLVLPILDNNT